MRINNIGYLLKEGMRGIFLHGFMSFAAVCVTVACLLIVGSFSILAYNLDVMVDKLNQTSEIMALLQEINNLGTTVLVVTHEKDLVELFHKRVIAINEGVVVSDGEGYFGYENQ